MELKPQRAFESQIRAGEGLREWDFCWEAILRWDGAPSAWGRVDSSHWGPAGI